MFFYYRISVDTEPPIINEKEAKGLFQILPFYNKFIEKQRIKHLKKMHEFPASCMTYSMNFHFITN